MKLRVYQPSPRERLNKKKTHVVEVVSAGVLFFPYSLEAYSVFKTQDEVYYNRNSLYYINPVNDEKGDAEYTEQISQVL